MTRNDELASARRRFQHLTGQSGSDLLRKDKEVKCLRDRFSEKKQAELSLKTLVLSLQRFRKES